jgi:flavin reductase (DIM6/NTAB) family NADH-FMN oxidoreductase RutF
LLRQGFDIAGSFRLDARNPAKDARMYWDMDDVDEPTAYKLLAATITPRPIAWVVTENKKGQRNAAPFSFFNAMGTQPPVLAIAIQSVDDKGFKDTAQNIFETAEFVVNLVPEAMVQAMNITAVSAPQGVNELDLAGLETLPSRKITPPRIKGSPVAFECRMLTSVVTGPYQVIVIGQVVATHIADDCLLDPARAHIDTPKLDLVARGYGSSYIRSQDRFDLPRPRWKDFAPKD